MGTTMQNASINTLGKTASARDKPLPRDAARAAASSYRIEAVDAQQFSLGQINAIRHNYHTHPLMQMDRLAELAKSLVPTEQCRFVARGTTVSSVFHHQKDNPDGRDIVELFRTIEEPGSWVALYDVQTDPEYQRFVWDVMASADQLVAQREKVFDVRGFIFISAPPSVTPIHIDRENNFWLQIHGRKTMNVWNRADEGVQSAADVEEFIEWGGGAMQFKDEMLAHSREFNCGPGDGVFFPSTSPHMTRSDRSWVKPGDGVAVSIGIVFYTDVTRHDAYVLSVNRMLRRYLHLNPRRPNESALIDGIKYPIGRAAMALRKNLRGHKPPPSFF